MIDSLIVRCGREKVIGQRAMGIDSLILYFGFWGEAGQRVTMCYFRIVDYGLGLVIVRLSAWHIVVIVLRRRVDINLYYVFIIIALLTGIFKFTSKFIHALQLTARLGIVKLQLYQVCLKLLDRLGALIELSLEFLRICPLLIEVLA